MVRKTYTEKKLSNVAYDLSKGVLGRDTDAGDLGQRDIHGAH